MIAGLPLGFAEPLVLFGLLTLPVLWWLLRMISLRPAPDRFSADAAAARNRTEGGDAGAHAVVAHADAPHARGHHHRCRSRTAVAPPARRDANAFAACHPDRRHVVGGGELAARVRTAEDVIARAEDDRRAVALIPLSEGTRDISLEPAGSARVRLHQMKPKPHTIDRSEALPAIARFLAAVHDVDLVWLSDGIDLGRGTDFIAALARPADNRPVTMVIGGMRGAHALTAADNAAGVLSVKVLRASTAHAGHRHGARARSEGPAARRGGATRSRADAREAEAQFDLPVEDPQRHRAARDRRPEPARPAPCSCSTSAGGGARRHRVGLDGRHGLAEPLLASNYLSPRARSGRSPTCASAERGSPVGRRSPASPEQKIPMIILADVGTIAPDERAKLAQWVEDGGVLVRFAGPRLAAADDELVPVKLRRGGRILGGSLSWEQPQHLAGFSREGPFAGMAVPNDVTVTRQVLPNPTPRSRPHLGDARRRHAARHRGGAARA